MLDFTDETVLVLMEDEDRFLHVGVGRQFLDHIGVDGTQPIPDSVAALQIYTEEGLRLMVAWEDGEVVLRRHENDEQVDPLVLIERIERVLDNVRRLQALLKTITIPSVVPADLSETLKALSEEMDLQPWQDPSRNDPNSDPDPGGKIHTVLHGISYRAAHPFG
jgi:hypothetical protein